MKRMIAPVTLTIVTLLSLGACSKSSDTATTNTAAPTTTTTAGGTKSTSGSASKSDSTEKTGTTSKAKSGFDFSSDEEQCIKDAVTANPDVAAIFAGSTGSKLTAEQAGAVGALIVNCVPKPKIADALVSSLKGSPKGTGITDTQLSCIRDQIVAFDSGDLAVFIGLLGYAGDSGDNSIAASEISKLNTACGTNIPA